MIGRIFPRNYLAGNAPKNGFRCAARILSRAANRRVYEYERHAINTKTKQVTLSDGRSFRLWRAVAGDGAEPVRLDIPGDDLPHVCYLRTLSDSRRIIEKARDAKRAVSSGKFHRAWKWRGRYASANSKSTSLEALAALATSLDTTWNSGSSDARGAWRKISSRSNTRSNSKIGMCSSTTERN